MIILSIAICLHPKGILIVNMIFLLIVYPHFYFAVTLDRLLILFGKIGEPVSNTSTLYL